MQFNLLIQTQEAWVNDNAVILLSQMSLYTWWSRFKYILSHPVWVKTTRAISLCYIQKVIQLL